MCWPSGLKTGEHGLGDASGSGPLCSRRFSPADGQQLLAMADSRLMWRFMNLVNGTGYFKGIFRMIYSRQLMWHRERRCPCETLEISTIAD